MFKILVKVSGTRFLGVCSPYYALSACHFTSSAKDLYRGVVGWGRMTEWRRCLFTFYGGDASHPHYLFSKNAGKALSCHVPISWDCDKGDVDDICSNFSTSDYYL